MPDLTAIYYTSNQISDHFAQNTRKHLLAALGDLPLISVSQKPMEFGQNIVFDGQPSHLNIYRQALIGAKAATTKYIAMAEDDVLYSPEHFRYRPTPGVFGYNMNVWAIYTWSNPPVFSYKDRANLHSMICERELFIEAMEERFAHWPDDSKTPIRNWAEPGKNPAYEENLGVTVRESEKFYTWTPSIAFSHETALSFAGLGRRKRLGVIRADAIPHWGTAKEVMEMYNV